MNFITHIQGDPYSHLTPLFLIHAISGVALPYFALDSLAPSLSPSADEGRPVYGISSPVIARRHGRMAMTFEELAQLYLYRIKKEVQPNGPYLLGGWSFGGMIAMKIAEILQRNNEEVVRVIMMDSGNPARYPKFGTRREMEDLAKVTFGNVVQSVGRSPLHHDEREDEGYDGGPLSVEEELDSLVAENTAGRGIAGSGSVGGDIDSNSSSDDESGYDSNSGNESSDDSDGEEEDEAVFGAELFGRMRSHIYGGLQLISRTKGEFFTPSWRARFPVTLIKCTVLANPSPLFSEGRRKFMQKTFRTERLGWDENSFEKGIEVKHIKAEHDRMFDSAHVNDLSDLLRDVLLDVEFSGL